MKIMSVDLGDARTGIAICDKTEFLASPLGTIYEKEPLKILQKVAIAAVEYGAQQIVVGLPLNMDGSSGERAKKAEEFANRLKQLVSVPIVTWDERQSTMAAAQHLNATNTRGKKRKEVIDQVAAVVILEGYLAYRKNHPELAND